LEYPPSDRRTDLRQPILVTQVKMGDERKYFFGYAINISRSGIFIQTVSPKDVGCEFSIEFTIPKTDITVKCGCRVIWSRKYSKSGKHEPGMGLEFTDLDPAVAGRIEEWIIKQQASAS
jgi:uncharacterized protein (TIGR02266 family)